MQDSHAKRNTKCGKSHFIRGLRETRYWIALRSGLNMTRLALKGGKRTGIIHHVK
jgi:hypothetical protein